ncbi:MAG: hypothetical protein JXR31_13370, partial [Prolixibacteraceae bacterium]|nr:hypothetical protein [Prolixibacteraceae bacterium]
FKGSKEEFLKSLNMVLKIFPAKEEDLKRAEELTSRTNQLNTTGITFSYNELNIFRCSENYMLIMTNLKDKYGSYGHIGLSLIECRHHIWTIKLLLMSCRVITRGIGSAILAYITSEAKKNHAVLRADFIETDVNRMTNILFRFSGFKELNNKNGKILFEYDRETELKFPDYINLVIKN